MAGGRSAPCWWRVTALLIVISATTIVPGSGGCARQAGAFLGVALTDFVLFLTILLGLLFSLACSNGQTCSTCLAGICLASCVGKDKTPCAPTRPKSYLVHNDTLLCLAVSDCPLGKYATGGCTGSCTSCPTGATTTAVRSTSSAACICNVGYTGPGGATACTGKMTILSCLPQHRTRFSESATEFHSSLPCFSIIGVYSLSVACGTNTYKAATGSAACTGKATSEN